MVGILESFNYVTACYSVGRAERAEQALFRSVRRHFPQLHVENPRDVCPPISNFLLR